MTGSIRKYLVAGMLLLAVIVVAMAAAHIRAIMTTAEAADPSAAPEEVSSTTDTAVGKVEQIPSETSAAAPEMPTLWQILKNGGVVMVILFLLSIVTVAFIVYYLLALTRVNIMPPAFMNRLQEILSRRRFDEAGMFCRQHNNLISSIVAVGIEATPRGHSMVRESMSSEGARQASSLWQKISHLNDIAIVAPMLGLLGTVVGMLESFLAITMKGGTSVGTINPAALANGVAKALITTVGGLIVGIIATIAYAYFRGVVQRLIITMESTAARFAVIVEKNTRK